MIYKNFKAGDIFEFNSSKGVFHAVNVTIEDKKTKKNHPYIVRTSQNNGLRGYIQEDETRLNPKNTISFAQDTAEMFWQAEPYFTGNKVKVLTVRNHEINESEGIFLITCLKRAFSTFSWGASYDTKILVEVPIALPIRMDENGNPIIDRTLFYHKEGYVPDWDYMQERIAELEQERIAELEQYLIATGLNDYELTDEDIKTLSLSLVSGITKNKIVKMLLGFAMKSF